MLHSGHISEVCLVISGRPPTCWWPPDDLAAAPPPGAGAVPLGPALSGREPSLAAWDEGGGASGAGGDTGAAAVTSPSGSPRAQGGASTAGGVSPFAALSGALPPAPSAGGAVQAEAGGAPAAPAVSRPAGDVVSLAEEVPLLNMRLQGARLHLNISGDAFAVDAVMRSLVMEDALVGPLNAAKSHLARSCVVEEAAAAAEGEFCRCR